MSARRCFATNRPKPSPTIRKYNSRTQSFDVVEYAGYKANREAMPVDLVQQLPYIRRALDALRIPMLQYEGYEADDVIGTLALQASQAGHPVYIVSSDKDMMQLVNEQRLRAQPRERKSGARSRWRSRSSGCAAGAGD